MMVIRNFRIDVFKNTEFKNTENDVVVEISQITPSVGEKNSIYLSIEQIDFFIDILRKSITEHEIRD